VPGCSTENTTWVASDGSSADGTSVRSIPRVAGHQRSAAADCPPPLRLNIS
jgi:hypothetical protein